MHYPLSAEPKPAERRHSLCLPARITVLLLAGLMTLAVLFGCGNGDKYAVVLWAPDDQTVEDGSLLPVIEESRIDKTVTLELPSGEPQTTPNWRVKTFGSRRNAQEFKQSYAEYAGTYAAAKRDGLPVRKEADRLSKRTYKLRLREEIKILERTEEVSNEGGMEDYWYRVLTREGVSGWCFGQYLDIYQSGEQVVDADTGKGTENTDLQRFLENKWRPSYYRNMARNNTVVTDLFRPEYGLFPEPEENWLVLNLQSRNITFDYTRIAPSRRNQYVFEGTSLILTIVSEKEISIQYQWQGSEVSGNFILFEEDIEEILEQEIERREEVLQTLYDRGPKLKSSTYGTIEVNENGTFRWEGYDRLVPEILPRDITNTGRLDFGFFPGEDLRAEYDGAIVFRFYTGSGDRPAAFLYRYEEKGLLLEFVPQNLIEDHIIKRRDLSSTKLFFSLRN
ncbi:MAG: SH3 domain-containing protein [Spirochaetales bacterium]|nr:SH3 domain-containing protein [Spirochaetales bacterium]MCF7939186.1 SH3 domain-containing protein [Spirochaetales bacterium]